MMHVRVIGWLTLFVVTLLGLGGSAYAADIGGTINSTLTIAENSRLIADVNCTVTGAPCLTFGASGVTLDLNGYSITGLGDPVTACGGGATGSEVGILVNALQNVVIRGLGVVQRFRNQGIQLTNSTGVTLTGVTMSGNCASGVIVVGGSNNLIDSNISIRNGNSANACGGI